VAVGIGQLAVTKDPAAVLVAYGLGSCVGLSIFDPAAKVAGMVHVLLPDSEGKAVPEPGKFADTGVDALLRQMAELGALKARMVVKAVGGASVLGAANAEKFKIGDRNAEAIQRRLRHHGLRLVAQDLGGVRGRTLELHASSGRTFVRTAASAPNEL
jgi:chemotaxis protein CheD